MKSLWARYNEELNGPTFIEREWGFISYSPYGEGLFIGNIYVIPEERTKGRARELLSFVEAAAKEQGKTFLLGQVRMDSETKLGSLHSQLATGFVPHSAEGGILYLRKELDHG